MKIHGDPSLSAAQKISLLQLEPSRLSHTIAHMQPRLRSFLATVHDLAREAFDEAMASYADVNAKMMWMDVEKRVRDTTWVCRVTWASGYGPGVGCGLTVEEMKWRRQVGGGVLAILMHRIDQTRAVSSLRLRTVLWSPAV